MSNERGLVAAIAEMICRGDNPVTISIDFEADLSPVSAGIHPKQMLTVDLSPDEANDMDVIREKIKQAKEEWKRKQEAFLELMRSIPNPFQIGPQGGSNPYANQNIGISWGTNTATQYAYDSVTYSSNSAINYQQMMGTGNWNTPQQYNNQYLLGMQNAQSYNDQYLSLQQKLIEEQKEREEVIDRLDATDEPSPLLALLRRWGATATGRSRHQEEADD